MSIALDFLYWIDRANPVGIIPWPVARAKDEIAGAAIERQVGHGRITLWLWRAPNQVKAAFAMARIGGDGGDKPVRVIRAAPPERDDDKAQLVFEGERL